MYAFLKRPRDGQNGNKEGEERNEKEGSTQAERIRVEGRKKGRKIKKQTLRTAKGKTEAIKGGEEMREKKKKL